MRSEQHKAFIEEMEGALNLKLVKMYPETFHGCTNGLVRKGTKRNALEIDKVLRENYSWFFDVRVKRVYLLHSRINHSYDDALKIDYAFYDSEGELKILKNPKKHILPKVKEGKWIRPAPADELWELWSVWKDK